MKKAFKILYITLSVIFFLWIGLSYIDIIADNCETITEHSDYNFFVLIAKEY